MPLHSILAKFCQRTGLSITDQRALALSYINDGALDLYSKIDAVGSLREQVFVFDATAAQVTLPFYVGNVRGMREYQTGLKIDKHDMRPRYATTGWAEQYKAGWLYREKQVSAIQRDITNEGVLTLRLPDGETVDAAFTVYITGSNAQKYHFTEAVVFAVGDYSKNTTNLFSTIDSISKQAVSTKDIYVDDPDGNELAYLPNVVLSSKYTLFQILDIASTASGSNLYVEILYKHEFIPFYNDMDEFVARGYDQVILFKALEHYYSSKEDQLEKVLAFRAKAQELIDELSVDKNIGTKLELQFGTDGWYDAQSPYNKDWQYSSDRFYVRP